MHKTTDAGEILVGMAAPEEVTLTVLKHLKNGRIDEAVACFAGEFTFKDHGIGLEFKDKERLSEFFWKTRELYPDSFLETDTILVSADHVIIGWTFKTTLTEPFYGGLSRKIPIVLRGVSIVRTVNGKIADWTDYYDGLTSRRNGLAAHFEECVDL